MDLQVVRTFPGELYLQWRDAQISHRPVEIYVQRSGSYTGPYVEIAGPLQDYVGYRDTLVERGVRYYYRLRIVTDGQTSYIPESGGITTGVEETLLIAEVRYRMYMDLYLRKDLVLYYPAKSAGPRCVCYDSVRRKGNSACPLCYGTYYSGGFYNPIVLPIGRSPSQAGSGAETDRTKGAHIQITLPGAFQLHAGDVFVDSENQRWLIASLDTLRYDGAAVRYRGMAAPVPLDSVMVSLPADLTLLRKPDHLMRERVT